MKKQRNLNQKILLLQEKQILEQQFKLEQQALEQQVQELLIIKKNLEKSVNTYNHKVIQVPHYYEYDSNENPNGYWWCGHTSLKMTLEAFGIKRDLQTIHKVFLEVDKLRGGTYNYTTKQESCKYQDYCADFGLIGETINWFKKNGFRISAKVTDSSRSSFVRDIKNNINSGKLMIVYSPHYRMSSNSNSWGEIKHFYVIHGYKVVGNKIYLYVRDPFQKITAYQTEYSNFDSDLWWSHMVENNVVRYVRVSEW